VTGTDADQAQPLVITPTAEPDPEAPANPDDLAEFWRLYHDILARRTREGGQ